MPTTFIDDALKRLIANYGSTATFKNEATRSVNRLTGVVARTFTNATARCLVEESDGKKDFIYDISFVKGNSNFVMGGIFDSELVWVTVRKVSLNGFVPNTNTLIFLAGKAYQCSKITIEKSSGHYYRILARRTESSDLTGVVATGTAAIINRAIAPTVVIA